MIRGIILGAAGVIVAGLAAAYFWIGFVGLPANADAPPPVLEEWIARKALGAAVRRQAPPGPNPVALTDENLLVGIRLYGVHCAVCHGAADGRASAIARGLYQKPPQLAKHGVEDDPEGETYWKIAHGIRMTGMPAFGAALSPEQMWQVTLFLNHMDSLPPGPKKSWEALPGYGAKS